MSRLTSRSPSASNSEEIGHHCTCDTNQFPVRPEDPASQIINLPKTEGTSKELTSWKEIADYPGVTVRTAQKCEGERGLPVRRLTDVKGRVSVDPVELAEWKARNIEKPPWNAGEG